MANLVNFGILPLIFDDERDLEKIRVDDELLIADTGQTLSLSVISIRNLTQDYEFAVSHRLTKRQLKIIRSGGFSMTCTRGMSTRLPDRSCHARPARQAG